MRRIKKLFKKLNLKYILVEILLIFVGINLAIWFNNWNTSLQTNKHKKIVIKKIKEEIETNLSELLKARKENQIARNGFKTYNKLYGIDSNEVITSPQKMQELQQKYPSFFIITDSIKLSRDQYKYQGGTSIHLELVELTAIAWKTAQSLNIANEFNYNCLYDLESMYNLQSKIMKGFDKVADALEVNNMDQLMRILNIIHQFDIQLEKDYQKMLENLDSCK